MDVSTFDGRLVYSDYLRDLQVFLDLLQNMDMYFNRYPFSEAEEIKFAKLTRKASQYWTDLERDRKARIQRSIKTLEFMKDKLTLNTCHHISTGQNPTVCQPHRSSTIIPPPRHDIKDHRKKN